MVRLFKSSMISSNTKATAAMGALKAAASPAAAPQAVEGADAEVGEPELLTEDRGQSTGQLDGGAFPPEA